MAGAGGQTDGLDNKGKEPIGTKKGGAGPHGGLDIRDDLRHLAFPRAQAEDSASFGSLGKVGFAAHGPGAFLPASFRLYPFPLTAAEEVSAPTAPSAQQALDPLGQRLALYLQR